MAPPAYREPAVQGPSANGLHAHLLARFEADGADPVLLAHHAEGAGAISGCYLPLALYPR